MSHVKWKTTNEIICTKNSFSGTNEKFLNNKHLFWNCIEYFSLKNH